MSELVRAFFEGDFLTDFDSVYFFDGNSVRQYKASVEQRLTDTLRGSVAVRYGTIDGDRLRAVAASLGIVANPGRFWTARARIEVLPTQTGIALLVRGIRQQLAHAGVRPPERIRQDRDLDRTGPVRHRPHALRLGLQALARRRVGPGHAATMERRTDATATGSSAASPFVLAS